MCKYVADTNMHISEENMSMVVVLHVYVQSYNLNKSITKFREKIVLEEVYDTILDQLHLSVW